MDRHRARVGQADTGAQGRAAALRMKVAVGHRVPLSDAGLAVLDEARPIADPNGLVFPGITGRPMTVRYDMVHNPTLTG